MAPELLELRSHNTAQSDIFAYGILMFEIFARSNPYDGEDTVLSWTKFVILPSTNDLACP